MGIIRISANVYNVGVIDPFIRQKDLIKNCPFGTSYNSYFIDDRKTALIGIVNNELFDDFKYNLGLVCDIGAIDYLILNSINSTCAESVGKLLKISPNATIICTSLTKNMIDNTLHTDYKCITVDNGDKLKLGNSILNFIVSFDHMMTYFENDATLFSGNVFGADFAEPKGIDEDIIYKSEYDKELHAYFSAYVKPYSKDIYNIINNISEKTIYHIAPNNGIVITDNVDEVIAKYKEWCNIKINNKTVVLYCSSSGNTKIIAEAICSTLEKISIPYEFINMATATPEQCRDIVYNSKYVIVGSCTINNALPPVAVYALSQIISINNQNKKFLTFGSYGWSGEAIDTLAVKLQLCGMSQLAKPFKVKMKPTEKDIAEIENIIMGLNDLNS